MSENRVVSEGFIRDTYLNTDGNCKQNYCLIEQEYQEMLNTERQFRADLAELTSEELMVKLVDTPPSEQGGIVGISGYYFQMLVTIYYIIELRRGKWTFVSMEHHDDIVLGNEETKTVRFVQVKRSKEISKKVSETDIYTRTNSRNISWVDKLLENSKIFNSCEVDKQFELFCDYLVVDTSGRGKVEVQEYYRNGEEESFNWEISESDDLYQRLNQDAFDRAGQKIIYEEMYGHSLKELLGKLRFTFKTKTLDFIDTVRQKLADFINENLQEGAVGVKEEHVNWLIGELLSRCSRGQNKYLLFIDKEDAEKLIYELQVKCVEESKLASKSHDNTVLVDQAISALMEEIRGSDATSTFCHEVENALFEYRRLILSTLDKDNSIENLVNRFMKGKKLYTGGSGNNQVFINEFIKSSFIMYLRFEMFNISSEFERLLIHNSKKGEENFWISFYHAGMKNLKKAINGINGIIVETHLEEKLKLILDKTPLYTILHGQNIISGPCAIDISAEQSLENDKLPGEKRLTKVTKRMFVIPVHNINSVYTNSDEVDSVDEFIQLVESMWDTLKKAGDEN
ncbi:dsDNA nuclease domain-containing protein [Bacillus paranthracis]|uniref:dsDNA nuclease domain-containing protein n=1 Tax=Bacillus paranthracis TaxID=2026186 RepID=UPI003F6BBA83